MWWLMRKAFPCVCTTDGSAVAHDSSDDSPKPLNLGDPVHRKMKEEEKVKKQQQHQHHQDKKKKKDRDGTASADHGNMHMQQSASLGARYFQMGMRPGALL